MKIAIDLQTDFLLIFLINFIDKASQNANIFKLFVGSLTVEALNGLSAGMVSGFRLKSSDKISFFNRMYYKTIFFFVNRIQSVDFKLNFLTRKNLY
jgi:hypothetical protein